MRALAASDDTAKPYLTLFNHEAWNAHNTSAYQPTTTLRPRSYTDAAYRNTLYQRQCQLQQKWIHCVTSIATAATATAKAGNDPRSSIPWLTLNESLEYHPRRTTGTSCLGIYLVLLHDLHFE
jgi:hypothetical protein